MKKAVTLLIVKVFALAMISVGTAGLAGCNTMQGLGKDLSTLGNKIENKAEEKKN